MAARLRPLAGTTIARPFLTVVDVELPGEKPRRNEIGTRKTYEAARQLAIAARDTFDSFFGDYADYFVMRVVDLRDYTVRFEYY